MCMFESKWYPHAYGHTANATYIQVHDTYRMSDHGQEQ